MDDSQSIDFLYDFLYLDREKAHSWLAQLVAEGVPISSKYQSGSTGANNVSASGGVPALIKAQGSASSSVSQGLERNFNNEWSIPLNLIDMLDEEKFISRDLSTTEIGSIVHLKGAASIMDIRFLQGSWESIGHIMQSDQAVTHANKKAINAQKTQISLIGNILKVMPPLPQLYLQTLDWQIGWAVLKTQHMLVDTSALSLTYGSQIEGEWHVIAVLDAVPDEQSDGHKLILPVGNELTTSMFTLLNALREHMGRPADAYAINPIAIFRAIKPSPRDNQHSL